MNIFLNDEFLCVDYWDRSSASDVINFGAFSELALTILVLRAYQLIFAVI